MDSGMVRDILKLTATGMAGLFSGAAMYINIADHPARMTLDTVPCRAHFKEMFNRAAVVMPLEAVTGSLAATGVYFLDDESDRRTLWLVGTGLFLTILPFTKIVMMPDISKLCKDDVIETAGETWVRNSIDKWNKLHAVRTVLGMSTFGIFLYALLKK